VAAVVKEDEDPNVETRGKDNQREDFPVGYALAQQGDGQTPEHGIRDHGVGELPERLARIGFLEAGELVLPGGLGWDFLYLFG
jgi:hypothetical protein